MLEALMYFMSLFCHGFDAPPKTTVLPENGNPSIMKIRSFSRTAPNLVASESVLNCFLSCQILFSKSKTKHASRPNNMALSFHDKARMFAIGRGIGVERRVQVFSTGSKTCTQSNRFQSLSIPPKT